MTDQPPRSIFRLRCSKCGYTSITDDPNATHCTAEFVLHPSAFMNVPPERGVCGGEFDDSGALVYWWQLCDALGLPDDSTLDDLRGAVGVPEDTGHG